MGSHFIESVVNSVIEQLVPERRLQCLLYQYRSSPDLRIFGEVECHVCKTPLVIGEYGAGAYECCVYPECDALFCFSIDECACGAVHNCTEHMVDGEFCKSCASKFEHQFFK